MIRYRGRDVFKIYTQIRLLSTKGEQQIFTFHYSHFNSPSHVQNILGRRTRARLLPARATPSSNILLNETFWLHYPVSLFVKDLCRCAFRSRSDRPLVLSSRIAYMPASVDSALRSAPLEPSASLKSFWGLHPDPGSCLLYGSLRWIRVHPYLALESQWLCQTGPVAAMRDPAYPDDWWRRWALPRREHRIHPSPPESASESSALRDLPLVAPSMRRAPMASSSSMKIIAGDLLLASSKSSRTRRAPSPMYFCHELRAHGLLGR